jgi:exopolyphosphatase / guanosine-5'-triphosphate,3'-diphosphate pyrophosphatase
VHAAIDLGSNTVRLLIARLEHGQLVPLEYHREVTRLAGKFKFETGLAPEAMERTLVVLQQYSSILGRLNLQGFRMVGTEIVRKAVNQAYFQNEIGNRTGLQLEVLSGEEEAHLATAGVLEVLEPCPGHALIMDIGGGSTELTLVSNRRILWHTSRPLGVVTLCEQHRSDAERHEYIRELLEEIMLSLRLAGLTELAKAPSTCLVGTAGTVTTLAAVLLEMEHYQGDLINNTTIELRQLPRLRSKLTGLGPEELRGVRGLEAGREDLIVPGIDIVSRLMELFQKTQLTVCDYGLLEGLVIDQAKLSEGSSAAHSVSHST